MPLDASAAVALTVLSAGRHLHGLVKDESVLHGHVSPDGPGRTALVVGGHGVVPIGEVSVTALTLCWPRHTWEVAVA